MTTEITTRAAKGAPLTYIELDANFENLKETADAAFDATIGLGGKANASALGVSTSATNMGTFTGTIIPDNQTAKQALQALETATALKVDPDLSNADFKYPAATAAIDFPFLNLRTQRRNLGDFIDKAQWAACRAGNPAVATTNGLGQDALAAATADMAGAVGGEIILPDGYFRVAPPTITQPNYLIRGNRRSSVIQTTSATADFFDVQANYCTIAEMTFISTQVRTAGAYVRVRLAGQRFDCEDLTAYGAFTLLRIEGDPTDPDVQGGVYNARNLLAEGSVQNGRPYIINGGYLVNLDNIAQIGDPSVSALNGPLSGLLVTRCADLRVAGNSQFLNCQRALDVFPGVDELVASLRLEGGFYGTSYYGSRVSGGNGGSIVSFQATGSWFGENLNSGGGVEGEGAGLSLLGAAPGRLKQAILTACEFPLAQGDGLTVDQYATDVQVNGGWADGCGGAGYSFNGTNGFQLKNVRSGAQRFTGNGLGYYISGASDNFSVDIDDRGNTNPSTGPAPSPTKIYVRAEDLGPRASVALLKGDYSTGTGFGTDDGPAILAALQSLSASGGGSLVIPYNKRPYIGTSFEMPANTSIKFEHYPRGSHDGTALPSFSGTLWLSPTATITMGNGCEIHANLFRAGLTFGITAAQVASTFLGTAILLKSNCSDISIKGMILGFEYSIEPQDPSNSDGTKQHNRIDLNVVYDCINGPHIHNSYDISRHNSLHGWPFVTVTSASEANGAQLKRSGYALWLSGVNDWTMVFQHFSYGYGVGCRLTNCASVTVMNGGHDHVPGSTDGSIGYLIEGNAREITLVAPQAAGKQYGIVVNSTTPTGRLACEIVAPRVWVTTTIGIDILGGSVKVSGGTIRNDPVTTPNGIGIKNHNVGSAEVTLIGVDFRGLATGIENQAATSVLRHWLCTFTACNAIITDAYMPTIASSATIAPNGVDAVFNLTGTTNVGSISSPQRHTGKMVTFIVVSGLSFLTGGNIILRTGANTPVAAGLTISFVSDGTNWREV